MKTTLYVIGIAIGVALMLAFMQIVIQRQEVYECTKWAGYAEEYPGFYLVEWQSQQCEYRGIQINAPTQ